jgi:2-hydroxycyclohexanecarboxyl-CoA dehydrogenase
MFDHSDRSSTGRLKKRGAGRTVRGAELRIRREATVVNLENKVALVTGAASGIGRAIAVGMAGAGAMVAAVDRDADGLASTVEAIGSDRARAHRADLGDKDAILTLRDEVVAAHGVPDVIVNAAGFDRVEPFMANDDALWEALATVNFLGPVRLTHAFLESILAQERRVKIVNIASDAGRVGSMGETVYAGTKGGLIAFTKSLAREMARHQITVNCVCPGPTDTPLLATVPEKVREALVRAIPFRRLAAPEEIADAVLFFASDRANYVTGQVLSVSGGLTMAG